MALFSQDTPVPQPIAKPKPAAPKPTNALATAAPVVTGPLTPATVNSPQTPAGAGTSPVPSSIVPDSLSVPSATGSPVPLVPVSPGSLSIGPAGANVTAAITDG